jgi:hypothetical protein
MKSASLKQAKVEGRSWHRIQGSGGPDHGKFDRLKVQNWLRIESATTRSSMEKVHL